MPVFSFKVMSPDGEGTFATGTPQTIECQMGKLVNL